MELALILVVAILVILQVAQLAQKKNSSQGQIVGATNTEEIKNIVRDSLDTAITRLTEQARTDRDEAIKLGSQQVSKDSAEQLGSRADTINQTLTSIKNAMDKKIEDLDTELREFRENNKSQFDSVEVAVGA